MYEALCRSFGTTLDMVHDEDGPPITQRTSGLIHTCAKLGIDFWDYLGNRIGVTRQNDVLKLADLIRSRGQPA